MPPDEPPSQQVSAPAAVNPASAQHPNLTHPGGSHGKRPRSKYEILVALRKHKGVRKAAAAELGITCETLSDRITGDPQLKQLYGGATGNGNIGTVSTPPVPTEADAEERGPENVPLEAVPQEDKDNVAGSLRLISLVSPKDSDRLIRGLKAFDFSEASLEKIRALGDLATNTGRFIAVSLEKTHQNYVVQQFGLMELAADIRRRLLLKPSDDGYVADEETRTYLHKNYVEMVRESGRGVERMLQVAEVITRMLEAAGSKAKTVSAKKGWRKVTAVEAQQNGEKAGP